MVSEGSIAHNNAEMSMEKEPVLYNTTFVDEMIVFSLSDFNTFLYTPPIINPKS